MPFPARAAPRLAALALLTPLVASPACSERAGPSPASAVSTATPAPSAASAPAASATAPAASASAPAASATAAPSAAPDAGAEEDAAGEDAGARADNKVLPPRESEDLEARARGLFEAVVKNEPELGEPFWFPKEPFVPLKDVKNPGKYWDELHRLFVADVKDFHRKRKSWEGARYKRFELGSTPKWVPPGEEANKIGYYRSFRGKVFYELDGKTYHLPVHTVISWQGRWYITHLGKIRR